MTAVLLHLPASEPVALSFQADSPSLRISGESNTLNRVELWHLGGITAQLTLHFAEAQRRFAAAADLALEAGESQSLREALVAWAACLSELGSFDEAESVYLRAIDAASTPEERAVVADESVSRLLQIMRNGVIFAEDGGILSTSEEVEARIARTAVSLLDAATANSQTAELPAEQQLNHLWLESHVRALDAWITRRSGTDPDDAVVRAQAAVKVADRSAASVCSLEALDVLFFAYRDSGHVELAAETLCRVVDVLSAAITADVDDASLQRWIQNEARLPGVDVPLNLASDSHFQPPHEDFLRWSFNAVRSPSLGMLALRENAPSLSRTQIEQLSESNAIWFPRNFGTFRDLKPEAMALQMASLAQGGSLYIGRERWVDQLASGYLLLAALSGERPAWLDTTEYIKSAQRGYFIVATSLAFLGLHRLALQHCPRPPSCGQPVPPVSQLVPLTIEIADSFPLWNLAAISALECGETLLAMAIAKDGIATAELREDWAEAIRFRGIKAHCHYKQIQPSDVRAEHTACVSLLDRVAHAPGREELFALVEQINSFLGPDDLRSRERELLISEKRSSSNAQTRDEPDFDKQLDLLLSSARAYLSLGHLDEASISVKAAEFLVESSGAVAARFRVLRERAALASALGDLDSAFELAEQSLTSIEISPDPELDELGIALGLVGIYRLNALEQANLDRETLNKSNDLARAVKVLERSLEIHRKLGARKDVMINLINLGMASGLRRDVLDQLIRYLDALSYCTDFDPNSGPIILYPGSCVKIWTNIMSVCRLLCWFPEALLASEICLDLASGQLASLIFEENKITSFSERDRIVRFSLWTQWEIINSPSTEPIEMGREEEEWQAVRALRSNLARMFEQYAICPAQTLQALAGSIYRTPDEAKPELLLNLWGSLEEGKSRVLREHLRDALAAPSSLPPELRDRELAAFEVWRRSTRNLRTFDNPEDLKSQIHAERHSHEALRSTWDEIEQMGGDAVEYARLRSGRNASFEAIKSCLGEVAN